MSFTGKIAAVVTLALALGANAITSAIVEAFFFSSLGVPQPDRLVAVEPVRELPGRGPVPFLDRHANYLLLRQFQRPFAETAAYLQGNASWDVNGETRPLQSSRVTATFFATTQVGPLLGRPFAVEDEGAIPAPVVLISYALWSSLGRLPSIVGEPMKLDGVIHTVVGVMPQGFVLPEPSDIWLPMSIPASWTPSARQLSIYARLAPQVTMSSARVFMDGFAKHALEADSVENRDYRYRVRTVREQMLGGVDRTISFVQAGALLLLLLALSNLCAMFLIWAFERQHEIAIRRALGSSSAHILQLFLLRSSSIVGCASLLGVAIACLTLPLVRALNPNPSLAFLLADVRMDRGSLLVTVLLTIVTAMIAGALPARYACRQDPSLTLRGAARSGGVSAIGLRWQMSMVVVQAGLAVVILFGAAVSALSFRNLILVPVGFEPGDRLVMRINLPDLRYGSHDQRAQFADTFLEKLREDPAIHAAGLTSSLPVGDQRFSGRFERADAGTPEPFMLHHRRVSPSYFGVIGLPILRGRSFDSHDSSLSQSVAIISQAAADHLWPGADAVGKQLRRAGASAATYLIVGIVANTIDAGLSSPPGETIYVPVAQSSSNRMSVIIRPRGSPQAAITAVRLGLRTLDPSLAANNVTTLDAMLRQTNAVPRAQSALLGFFALVAIMITGLGSYNVMRQVVSSREREMAVRLAVGATPTSVFWMMLTQMTRLSLAGVVAGVLCAVALTTFLRPLVFGFASGSPSVIATAALCTLAITLLATIVPAVQASRVDLPQKLRS